MAEDICFFIGAIRVFFVWHANATTSYVQTSNMSSYETCSHLCKFRPKPRLAAKATTRCELNIFQRHNETSSELRPANEPLCLTKRRERLRSSCLYARLKNKSLKITYHFPRAARPLVLLASAAARLRLCAPATGGRARRRCIWPSRSWGSARATTVSIPSIPPDTTRRLMLYRQRGRHFCGCRGLQ